MVDTVAEGSKCVLASTTTRSRAVVTGAEMKNRRKEISLGQRSCRRKWDIIYKDSSLNSSARIWFRIIPEIERVAAQGGGSTATCTFLSVFMLQFTMKSDVVLLPSVMPRQYNRT